jgi:hypothetical protein
MKYTDIQLLYKDEYFHDALWVTEKLGLHKLMSIKQDYCPNLIQQFYATLEFGTEENVRMTWMTNNVKRFSTFARFAQLLGYPFSSLETPSGHRMHINTSEYNKEKLALLSSHGSTPEETSSLLPIYNMLLRIFRANISPSGGNNDAVCGGLVNLLHFAYVTFEEGEKGTNRNIDVMHFFFFEMHLALVEKKVPPYAPYIMMLILDKENIEEDIEVEYEGMVTHQHLKLYKKHSVATTQGQGSSIPSGNYYASGSRRKNADPPSGHIGSEIKKLKWWQRGLFCMNNDVRQTQYKDYVERKRLHKRQRDLDARLRVLEKGKEASTQDEPQEHDQSEDTFSFGKWNEGSSFDWKELSEVTSKGKDAIEEDEDEDGSEDGDDASDDGGDEDYE